MVGPRPAIAGPSKDQPPVSVDDPRSGAALNRDQAHHPRPQPQPVLPGDATNRINGPAVNNPAADLTAQDTQSETTIAVLPNNPVIAWNDSGSFNGSNNHFTGYGLSTNNGDTFVDKGALPASTEGDSGDPVLATHAASAALYLATLGFTTGENIQVFKSTNAGATFGAPVNGTPGYGGTGNFQDKEWITVDNAIGTGNGNVYLCWTRFGTLGEEEIRFTRSIDAGASFGPSGGLLLSGGGQGCFVVTGPDHSVYVFYYRGTGGGGQGGDNKIFVRKSTNLGVSFATEVQVADLLTTTTNGNVGLNGGVRSNSFPHAAVNPVTGAIYATFNDDPAGADTVDTYYVRSTNGGTTWTAPVQVNDDDGDRDQFFPTLSVSPSGTRIMFGYYSRSFDSANSAIHRRGRLAVVDTGTNAVTFRPSFQMGPNWPAAINQDPVINPTYMGDYDQIATDTAGRFHSSWSDNQDGNSFHANQPDVRYARINSDSSTVGLSVTLSDSPDPLAVGDTITYTATITNSGPSAAEDVYLNDVVPAGLVPQSASGGTCDIHERLVSCLQGGLNPGTSKTVTIIAVVTSTATPQSNTVTITTSDNDTSGANSATATTDVTGGNVATSSYSTGNIAVPIPDLATTDIPISVPDAETILDVRLRLRLNHTFDSDLDISLISPNGVVVKLSNNNGLDGDNFGSGPNDCSGSLTEFRDDAATPISAGVAPFPGAYRPEDAMSDFAGDQSDGTWTLRIIDAAGADVGTVGCVQVDIVHPK